MPKSFFKKIKTIYTGILADKVIYGLVVYMLVEVKEALIIELRCMCNWNSVQ